MGSIHFYIRKRNPTFCLEQLPESILGPELSCHAVYTDWISHTYAWTVHIGADGTGHPGPCGLRGPHRLPGRPMVTGRGDSPRPPVTCSVA